MTGHHSFWHMGILTTDLPNSCMTCLLYVLSTASFSSKLPGWETSYIISGNYWIKPQVRNRQAAHKPLDAIFKATVFCLRSPEGGKSLKCMLKIIQVLGYPVIRSIVRVLIHCTKNNICTCELSNWWWAQNQHSPTITSIYAPCKTGSLFWELMPNCLSWRGDTTEVQAAGLVQRGIVGKVPQQASTEQWGLCYKMLSGRKIGKAVSVHPPCTRNNSRTQPKLTTVKTATKTSFTSGWRVFSSKFREL